MSQDAKDISFSINEETFAFAIQSLVNNTLKTWHHRNTSSGSIPTLAGQDFAMRNLQASVYQAIYEGSKWMPLDAKAGAPAGGDDAAEKFDIFTSRSGSAAQRGTGTWTPPSLENE
eukprot:6655312-Pyramimonas_sp.AAC.1